jgi:hypothetical protein
VARSQRSQFRAHNETLEGLGCDIPASLTRLVKALSPGKGGAEPKIRACYISNPGMPQCQHRIEDRSEVVLSRLRMIQEQGATMPAGHVEAHLVRAGTMIHDFRGDPTEVEFATRMLIQRELFNAARVQKTDKDLPLPVLAKAKASRDVGSGPIVMPETTVQATAVPSRAGRRKR